LKKLCITRLTDKSGFSLAEMMVAVGILATAIALGAPQLGKMFATAPEGEEIEVLKSTLLNVRNRAIAGDVCTKVQVLNPKEILTEVYDDCGPPLAGMIASSTYQFKRLSLTNFSSGGPIQFLSSGGTTEAGPVTLTITTETNKSYELAILPAIGNIRMKKK